MVKNKPRNQTSVTNASKTIYASYLQDVIETIQNRVIDITNEIAKVQPQYAESLSNLQVEYFEATKNVIQNVSNLQSTFLENNWNNFDNKSAIYRAN
jgi:prophage DNA circulation protein